jgi:hypothetical protein
MPSNPDPQPPPTRTHTSPTLQKLCTASDTPDWEVLHGLLEGAVYGGRVDDETDAERLRALLRMFFRASSFTAGGSTVTSGTNLQAWTPPFPVPKVRERKPYVQLINDLPEADDPASLFLPRNIEGDLQRTGVRVVVDNLRKVVGSTLSLGMFVIWRPGFRASAMALPLPPSSLSPRAHPYSPPPSPFAPFALHRPQHARGHAAHTFDREAWSSLLSPVLVLWKNANTGNALLSRSSAAEAAESPATPSQDPMVSFLHLEVTNALQLVRRIHKDLAGISKLIRSNTLLPSAECALVAGSLMQGLTPAS